MSLVLIIEDDDDLRAGLATGLARAGFPVIEATDGEAAYAMILETRPDLVLCDICIPRITGHDLLRRIRSECPELARMPFLFLTALDKKQDILTGHELGADEYLTKPIDLELLIAIIHKRLEQTNRWLAYHENDVERERIGFLATLSEQTQLSFLSAAEVLNHLAEGILLLDPSGKVIFVNRYAMRILSEEDGIILCNGMLICNKSAETQQLDEWLRNVLGTISQKNPTSLMLSRPSGRQPYAIRVCRLEAGLDLNPGAAAAAAIFLSDPDPRIRPSEELLIGLYHFTPAEARIVADLTSGLSVSEIMQGQKISRNTVHHHLKSIFRKTNTMRQSELVSVVLSGMAAQASAWIVPVGGR